MWLIQVKSTEESASGNDGFSDSARAALAATAGSPPASPIRHGRDRPPCIFDNFSSGLFDVDNEEDGEDDMLSEKCHSELQAFLHIVNSQPIKNSDGDFNDPLAWWSVNEHKFPTLAKLARAFLAIPATSAASERVWSRASQVLSIRRSRMDPELAQRIMYTRENNRLLHMYYEELTEKPVADAYLPPLRDTETDIGQHDHLLLF